MADGGDAIRVVYEALGTAASQLEAAMKVADEISAHSRTLTSLSGGAGDANVTAAIDSFLDKWAYGLSCLHSDAATLSTALSSAAGKYQRLETQIAAASGGK